MKSHVYTAFFKKTGDKVSNSKKFAKYLKKYHIPVQLPESYSKYEEATYVAGRKVAELVDAKKLVRETASK